MAPARVTTALRYCSGSSGPSHSFCHVTGHWYKIQPLEMELFIHSRFLLKKEIEYNQSKSYQVVCATVLIKKLGFELR